MNEILPNLYRIMPDEYSEQRKPTFLLVRPRGNLLFGNARESISKSYNEIEKLGKVIGVYIGDRHHGKTYSSAALYFNAPFCCSKEEANVMRKKKVKIDKIVEFKQHKLFSDLEVIPTPGHTPGALSYLWACGRNKILFIGDTIVPIDNEWKLWVNKTTKARAAMIETMERLRKLKFNYIISDSFAATGDNAIKLSPKGKEKMIESVIASVS